MKIGLVVANTGEHAVANVRHWPAEAEALGYSAVWFTDHVVGVRAFAPRFGPVWMELLSSLSHAAGRTSAIRLGSGVMVVPYRDPVYTAKVLATIDQLCDGRLDVGVGVGWARAEYRALGVGDRFEHRGAWTDEALDVMHRCWQGGEVSHDGTFSAFRGITFAPVPVQRPGPPLWVGGHSPAALRRAARFGAVWHPMGLEPEQLADTGARLDALAGGPVRRTTRLLVDARTDPAELLDRIDAFAAAGCEEVAVDLETSDPTLFRRAARRLAEAASLEGAAAVATNPA